MKKLIKLLFLILILSFTIYSVTSFASTNEITNTEIVNEVNTIDLKNEVDNNNNINSIIVSEEINESNSNDINSTDIEVILDNENVEDVSNESTELLAYTDGLVKIGNDWRVVVNGKIDYNYTGIATNQNGTWFVKNGTIKYDYTGHYTDKNGKTYIIEKNKVMTNLKTVMKIDNIWRMVINGVVDYNYTGIGTNDLGTWLIEKGKVTFNYTGTYFEGEKAYIIEASKVKAETKKTGTTLVKIGNDWRVAVNGYIDYNYIGIVSNQNGTWFVRNGTIKYDYTGNYTDKNGKTYIIEKSQVMTGLNKVIKIDNIWRMVVKGIVDYNYKGIGTNENGTWYLENGKVGFDYTGTYFEGDKAYIAEESKVYATVNKNTTEVIKINGTWRMVINGKVNYNYTGIGKNNLGTWLVEKGKVTFNYTGIYNDNTGTYIIQESKVDSNFNKVIKIDNIWRMVVKGIVDYNYTGIGTNENGTWYLENGKVGFDYTGTKFIGDKAYIVEESKVKAEAPKVGTALVKIDNDWRVAVDGYIDYKYTGIVSNQNGTWFVKDGTIKYDYTGHYKAKDGKTYVIENSKVQTHYTGVMKIENIWRMVVKGIVDYNYDGIGTNIFGTWYVQKGQVTLSFTGTYFNGDKAYIAEDSKVYATVNKNTTEVIKINNIWRMIINGKVNYTYNGIGSNSLGIWVLQNGTVNFGYTGEYTDPQGSVYNAKEGKVREVIKNVKYPGTMWVDSPAQNSRHASNVISVSGWALSDTTGDIIRIYLDDKFVAEAPRKQREDVFVAYPNSYGDRAKNPQPGFEYNLNISNVSNGNHIIKIVNVASDRNTIIQSREVQFNIVRLEKQHRGIDVSKYQGNINWQAVKNSGVDFAILRIGYYLQSSNTVVKDPWFESYYNSCRSLGIAVGGYFYSYAFNGPEAAVEAEACVSIIRGKYFDMPIFIDVEDNVLKNAVANGTTNVNELTNASITFCDKMIANGYQAGVYASKNFFQTYLNAPVLERYNIWLAHYTSQTDYTGRYDVWQYTSQGSVPGIDGPVDLDWSMKKFFNMK